MNLAEPSFAAENGHMSTKAVATDPNLEAVLRYLKQSSKDRKESDVQGIRNRAEQARAEIRQRHGVLDVAVELVRESRNRDDAE
jgi:hypothetical protein